MDNIFKIVLLFITFLLFSCEFVPKDANTYYRYKPSDYTNRRGAGSLENMILSGRDPSGAINDYMYGPTGLNGCPPVLDDSFVTPSEPGERPLRGSTLLEYVRDNYPGNCGYTFRGWSNQDSRNFRPNIEAVAQGRIPRCHESNCSTATYLALVEAIRGTEHEERLRNQLHMGGPLYESFVIRPNMIENTFGRDPFNLGPYQKMERTDEATIRQYQESGWPSPGDFLILNRRNGTGHSVLFSHYQGEGSNRQVCYWSSNRGTNGMGMQCERMSRMASVHMGRVE